MSRNALFLYLPEDDGERSEILDDIFAYLDAKGYIEPAYEYDPDIEERWYVYQDNRTIN